MIIRSIFKNNKIIIIECILVIGLLSSPFFVLAGGKCTVDKNKKENTSDDLYEKISDAISAGCREITIKRGKYKENIILKKGTEVKGKGRGSTIIDGKVIMKNESKMEELTVFGRGGVVVSNNANAKLEEVEIKGAIIGIKTTGTGELKVIDVKIHSGNKGFYLQKGKNISIVNSRVYDNKEEGIDIRANVDGVINGNQIYNNDESGIEVILGKSDLIISNNVIKENGASGIATQYYKESSSVGGVNVKNNVISGNRNFGLDCRIPQGGIPLKNYWSNSIQFSGNAISDNKKGAFSLNCYFNRQKIINANLTEEQQSEKRKQELLERSADKKMSKKEKLAMEAEKLEKENQEKNRRKNEKFQNEIQEIILATGSLYKNDILTREDVNSRPLVLVWVVGYDKSNIAKLKMNLDQYRDKKTQAEKLKDEITEQEMKDKISEEIKVITLREVDIKNFVQKIERQFNFLKIF